MDARRNDDRLEDRSVLTRKHSQSSMNMMSPGRRPTMKSYDVEDSGTKEVILRRFNIHPGRLARLQYKVFNMNKVL